MNLRPVSTLVTREVPGLDPHCEGRSLIGCVRQCEGRIEVKVNPCHGGSGSLRLA